jgi:hypothetical protein
MGMAPEPDPLPPAENPAFEQILMERKPVSEDAAAERYPKIVVLEKLVSPHPAVRRAAEILRSKKGKSDDFVSAYDVEAAHIAVSRRNVARALRIMDVVYKAIEAEGLKIIGRERWGNREAIINSSVKEYPLKLREPSKRSERQLTAAEEEAVKRHGYVSNRFTYALSGQLVLTIGDDYLNPIIVRDTVRTRLEDKIGVAIGRLRERIVRDEEEARRRAIEEAERQRVREEQRRKEEEAEKIRKLEEERVNRLQKELTQWRHAKDIREYVATIDGALRRHGAQPTDGGPLDVWLTWLEAHAKKVDPLGELYDELKRFSEMMAAQRASGQTEDPLEDTSGHA